MTSKETRVDVPTIVTAGRTLALATIEYRNKPTDPAKLWEFQTAHWGLNRYAMSLSPRDVIVADCPFNEDQLRKLGRVDFPLYLPLVTSTAPEGLKLQSKVYPTMRWDIQDLGNVKNVDREGREVSLSGWLWAEKSINAPYTKTNEDQAIEALRKANRIPQTLNVYAEAGNISRLISPKNKYLDQDCTFVRILSSHVQGGALDADFGPDGHCFVYWAGSFWPEDASPRLGVRSVGV